MPDKTVYRSIDYGMPVTLAKREEQNSIPTFSVISAIGADTDS